MKTSMTFLCISSKQLNRANCSDYSILCLCLGVLYKRPKCVPKEISIYFGRNIIVSS